MRVFFGIPLNPQIQKNLLEASTRLRVSIKTDAIKWTHINNLHITLKFLGDLPESQVIKFCHLLEQPISETHVFNLELSGLGVFPDARNPRIIWAGCDLPETLTRLVAMIEKIGLSLGIPSESKPFSAHITIGRIKRDLTPVERNHLRQALLEQAGFEFGKLHVAGFTLLKSDLKPTGPVYSTVQHFELIP